MRLANLRFFKDINHYSLTNFQFAAEIDSLTATMNARFLLESRNTRGHRPRLQSAGGCDVPGVMQSRPNRPTAFRILAR